MRLKKYFALPESSLTLAPRTTQRSGTSSTHHQMQEASGRIFCEFVSWLFSLPFTNSHVERLFSTLKIIKTDRRTRLHTATLSEIQVEGPPLASFSADQAVSLWWEDCKPQEGLTNIQESSITQENPPHQLQSLTQSWTQSFLRTGTSGFLEFRYSSV